MGFIVEFSFNDITYVGHIHLPITYSCPLSPTSDSSFQIIPLLLPYLTFCLNLRSTCGEKHAYLPETSSFHLIMSFIFLRMPFSFLYD